MIKIQDKEALPVETMTIAVIAWRKSIIKVQHRFGSSIEEEILSSRGTCTLLLILHVYIQIDKLEYKT